MGIGLGNGDRTTNFGEMRKWIMELWEMMRGENVKGVRNEN